MSVALQGWCLMTA